MRIEPADAAMFAERAGWRYPPPYDLYDDDGSLIGFWYWEEVGDALFYGLGLRPDLTGRGLGESFVRAGLDHALARHGPRRVVLDVAAFNARAIRVYRRVGFVETGRRTRTFEGHGEIEFVDMERRP